MTKILLFLLLTLPLTAQVSYDRLLQAIAEKETGNRPAAVGRAREGTPYQILPATWLRFSQVPMTQATPAESRRVALAILQEIHHHITHETAYEYALRWNAGSHARTFGARTKDYAQCVANLYVGTRDPSP